VEVPQIRGHSPNPPWLNGALHPQSRVTHRRVTVSLFERRVAEGPWQGQRDRPSRAGVGHGDVCWALPPGGLLRDLALDPSGADNGDPSRQRTVDANLGRSRACTTSALSAPATPHATRHTHLAAALTSRRWPSSAEGLLWLQGLRTRISLGLRHKQQRQQLCASTHAAPTLQNGQRTQTQHVSRIATLIVPGDQDFLGGAAVAAGGAHQGGQSGRRLS
jgi:hypothetical protein